MLKTKKACLQRDINNYGFFAEMKDCRLCPLSKIRKQVLIGKGSIVADVVFIKQCPTMTEDILGTAFMPNDNKHLFQVIEDASVMIGRNFEFLFLNGLFCRPSDNLVSATRTPRKDEVLSCRKNMLKVIEKVKPKAIVFCDTFSKQKFTSVFIKKYRIEDLFSERSIVNQGGESSPRYNHNFQKLIFLFNNILKDME